MGTLESPDPLGAEHHHSVETSCLSVALPGPMQISEEITS